MNKWNNWGKPILYIIFMFITVGVMSYFFGIAIGLTTALATMIIAPSFGVFQWIDKSR